MVIGEASATMNNREAFIIVVLLSLQGCAEIVRGDVYLSREEALEIAFARADKIEKKKEVLLPGQQEEILRLSGARDISRIFSYYAGFEGNRPVGYAMIGSARGTSRRFGFMMAVDMKFSIKMIEILSYQDMHGSEVRQGWFKRQFVGKRISDPIRINEDIRNVSGATISCEALVEKVRLSLATLTVALAKAQSKLEEGNATRLGESRGGSTHLDGTAATSLREPGAFRRAQYRMGTLLEVTLYARDVAMAKQSFRRVFEEIGRLESLLGPYRKGPLEEGAARGHVSGASLEDPEIVSLLKFCFQMNKLTHGAFDVTVSPLTRLWHEASRRNDLPSREELRRARSRAGATCVKFDPGQPTIEVLCEGVTTEFGGIGKGYALDRAVALLKEDGIEAALLNFGGMIRAYGYGPNKGKRSIHVRNPADHSNPLATLRITDGAVSTSGDSERSLQIRGKTYSHILDPRTGWPVKGMVSVTVVASSATEADALSTGLYVAGLKEGQRIAENLSLAALIVSEKGEFRSEAFHVLESDGSGGARSPRDIQLKPAADTSRLHRVPKAVVERGHLFKEDTR